MEPIREHNAPDPKDRLDQDETNEQTVDDTLERRHTGREAAETGAKPQGPSGEITNMEVEYFDTALDRPETDPFEDSSGDGPPQSNAKP